MRRWQTGSAALPIDLTLPDFNERMVLLDTEVSVDDVPARYASLHYEQPPYEGDQ